MKPYVVVQDWKSFCKVTLEDFIFISNLKPMTVVTSGVPKVLLLAPFSSRFLFKLLQKLQGMSAVAVAHLLDIEIEIRVAPLANESSILFFLFHVFFVRYCLMQLCQWKQRKWSVWHFFQLVS